MRLGRLSIRSVRSISEASVTLARHFTLVTGPNGAGKTNLLEAVHLAATLRALTTSVPAELVQHGCSLASVDATVEGGVLPLQVRVVVEGGRRRALVAGKPLREAEAYVGTLATVAFTPDDMRLVKDGPGGRRQFVSRCSTELWPAARDELRRLDRALRQRAAAMRRGANPQVLKALEEPLFNAALASWRRRERTLQAVRPHAQRWLAHLLDGKELRLRLRAGIDARSEGRFEAMSDEERRVALGEALASCLDDDRKRAATSYGPHHDKLELFVDGKDARRFASQGQQRCVALALTLAVVDAVHEARARPPLVLLDDVSSELDEARRRALFGALAQAGCQVVATATHLDLLPLPETVPVEVLHLEASGGRFTPRAYPPAGD